jgi:hypothetical protein
VLGAVLGEWLAVGLEVGRGLPGDAEPDCAVQWTSTDLDEQRGAAATEMWERLPPDRQP